MAVLRDLEAGKAGRPRSFGPTRPVPALTSATEVEEALAKAAVPARALVSARFFKTGPGQYGEGDRFRGIAVPQLRQLARRCDSLSVAELGKLLVSPWHEDRLVALICLIRRFRKGDERTRNALARLYLDHVPAHINNWDLIDVSAEHIVGPWLAARPRRERALLDRLARSPSLWQRRVAILTTLHFIRAGDFTDTLRLAETLLGDREDLIHKAAGWMLREVGQRDPKPLRAFLARHAGRMPRTMLRYSIEKLPPPERKRWMAA